ncbi:molecular chaperone DnaJ [Streptomyces sp. WAC 05977]|nr:molecular chaperone DnaJ [Streptomyces sp. WAC 05977]
MEWQIEPMPTWQYPETKGRKGNPFRANFTSTVKLLVTELDHLDVQGAVAVRVVADEADVRRDGMLRAKANVRHPGVALSFTSERLGALTYPCDAFRAQYSGEPADWQINLRAIALGLQHLRALDRYGIAGHGEQYTGWRAIEAAAPAEFDSVDAALRWLVEFADMARRDVRDVAVRDAAPLMLRRAARKAHPDTGGDPADWARVDAARQLLKKAQVIA